jgi:hypothetical protein
LYTNILWFSLLLAGCATDPPVHPMRLDDFPGHPIEGNLFPLRDRVEWVFEDRAAAGNPEVRLVLTRSEGLYYLTGTKRATAEVRIRGVFLEILREGRPVARPLKLAGETGDSWTFNKMRTTVYGYDTIEIFGERRRALVTAVESGRSKDLYWWVDGIGWARLRNEQTGRVVRDAWLVEFRPGSAN